jgi:hypothetical protein
MLITGNVGLPKSFTVQKLFDEDNDHAQAKIPLVISVKGKVIYMYFG